MGLGFGVCALAGEIVRCLQVMGRARAYDRLAPTGWALWLRSASRVCLAPVVVALLLCAKGLERAFDEGFACRAHCTGKGCDLV